MSDELAGEDRAFGYLQWVILLALGPDESGLTEEQLRAEVEREDASYDAARVRAALERLAGEGAIEREDARIRMSKTAAHVLSLSDTGRR